ncbi:MAG TPA: phosphotransferase family protein [Acidimicrobiales bacterium]|nr:phosphotransferase family protein [Acidimicrobiales bacterium]
MTDGPDLAHVASALQEWANERFGDGTDLVTDPSAVSGGLDTFIFRFRLSRGDLRPLILRLYPSTTRAPSAEREVAILRFLDGTGYPAPRPVDAGTLGPPVGLPFVIMEEVPGKTALERLSARPHRASRLVESMAAAQASLHALDPTAWPLPIPPGDEIGRRLDKVESTATDDPALVDALHWLQHHRGDVEGEDPAVCHYDFHPLNTIVDDDGRLAVIDWEGAGLGDRHSDLARSMVLYEWSPVVAKSKVERIVLRVAKPPLLKRYRAAYARHLPIDERRLQYWLAFHAAESWWEATTLLAGTFTRDTRLDERTRAATLVAPAMAGLFARLVPDAGRTTH